AALPPKDGFKPVDVSSGRAIDIDVLRFAVPAVLVIAVLGVLVWTMQRSGDALTGEFGGGAFPVPQQQDAEDRGDGQPAAAGAAGEQRSEQAGEDALADVSDSQQPAGPDPVVETPFPGAEDVRTTSAGPPLIPNWVDKFRSESVPPAHKVLVTRRAGADDGRQHRRLDQAFKALPRD